MAKLTINEALEVIKQLDQRGNELKQLRGENANRRAEMFGEKSVRTEPVYDIRALDQTINRISGERRKLSAAIKSLNNTTVIPNYDWSDEILGQFEAAASAGKAKRKG